jgi:hypothetical protein
VISNLDYFKHGGPKLQYSSKEDVHFYILILAVLRIWIRIWIRIRMFLGLLDPDPDPLVTGRDPDKAPDQAPDPDPFFTKQK